MHWLVQLRAGANLPNIKKLSVKFQEMLQTYYETQLPRKHYKNVRKYMSLKTKVMKTKVTNTWQSFNSITKLWLLVGILHQVMHLLHSFSENNRVVLCISSQLSFEKCHVIILKLSWLEAFPQCHLWVYSYYQRLMCLCAVFASCQT